MLCTPFLQPISPNSLILHFDVQPVCHSGSITPQRHRGWRELAVSLFPAWPIDACALPTLEKRMRVADGDLKNSGLPLGQHVWPAVRGTDRW